MFLPSNRLIFTCGTALLLALRTMAVCGLHVFGHCAQDECGAPVAQGDGWSAAHETHAHDICLCEQEPATVKTGVVVLKKVLPSPVFSVRRNVFAHARVEPPRMRVEKPPPGLVLKILAQMLC